MNDSIRQELMNKEINEWYISEQVKSSIGDNKIRNPIINSKGTHARESNSNKMKTVSDKRNTDLKNDSSPNACINDKEKSHKFNNTNKKKDEEQKIEITLPITSINDKLNTQKATKEKEEKDIKDIENEYLEEFNNDDDKDYIDSFDADKECKPKDIIPDKLYAEIPDLESSCEQSQQENGLTINCEKSQDNDGDDMCNYGMSPFVTGKSPNV